MAMVDDSAYDREMQARISAFMEGTGMEDELAALDDDDDEDEVELNVPDDLPDNCLDHVILACSNLKEGMETFEDMTGIAPKKIGSLRGVGTKSARVALDNNTFVEIIGPDPNAESDGMAPKLLSMPSGQLVPFHYVVRSKPDDVVIPENLGWEKDAIVMVHADVHDFAESGEVYKWDLAFVYGHGIGGCVPQFVNWRVNKYHPTSRLPKSPGTLGFVQVQAPEGHYVHELLRKVNDINLYPGEPELIFSLDTPKGNVTFKASSPEGIVMPGFGDDSHPTYSGKQM